MFKSGLEPNYLNDIIDYLEDDYDLINKNVLDKLIDILAILTYKYLDDEPIISDDTYDHLMDLVFEYGKKVYKNNFSKTTLTNMIDENVKRYFGGKTIPLPYNMFSLTKVNCQEQLVKWLEKIKCDSIIITPKFDGISAEFDVFNRILYTKGDGHNGFPILVDKLLPSIFDKNFKLSTSNFKQPKIFNNQPVDKPILLNYSFDNQSYYVDQNYIGFIRGELIISKQKFKIFNEEKSYSTARSLVVGLINSKKKDIDKLNLIDYITYEIIHPEDSYNNQLEILKTYNFKVTPFLILKRENIDMKYLNELYKKLEIELPYYIDGLVLRGNGDFPFDNTKPGIYHIAVKFPSQEFTVSVKNITWKLKSDKCYVPIIWFDPPIIYKNKEYLKANGINMEYLITKNISINTSIKVIFNGEIPKVIEGIKVETPSYNLPANTVIFNKKLMTMLNKENTQLEKRILFFLNYFKIKGMGEKTINGLLNEIPFSSKTTDIEKLILFLVFLEATRKSNFISEHNQNPIPFIDILRALNSNINKQLKKYLPQMKINKDFIILNSGHFPSNITIEKIKKALQTYKENKNIIDKHLNIIYPTEC
jgi:NAD-dependent DNA ligase